MNAQKLWELYRVQPRRICSGSGREERGCSAVSLHPDDLGLIPIQHQHQQLNTKIIYADSEAFVYK